MLGVKISKVRSGERQPGLAAPEMREPGNCLPYVTTCPILGGFLCYIENISKNYINYDIYIDILIDIVKDIPKEIEFGVKWKGKYLRPSKHAIYEMIKLGYDLYDVLSILEDGYDCRKGRRAKGTYEKCIKKGRKIIKVVVKRVQAYDIDDEVWLIIHVGGV